MKRRSLAELICADLANLAKLETDVVASEESIRFLMRLYQSQNRLINVHYVHKEKLQSFLIENNILQKNGHHQFIIEVGCRSKSKQYEPDTIHYCALDLFIETGSKPIAFVADHYRGHNGYYKEFANIATALNVQFLVVGGAIYQADSVHCPIFTLMHLLQTSCDEEIYPLLKQIKGAQEEEVVNFNWDMLTPSYLIYSQSVSMLFNYVDAIKLRDKSPANENSPVLYNAGFHKKLGQTVYAMFSEKENLNNKLRNQAIKFYAAKLGGDAVLELEKLNCPYDESSLINLCYQNNYPDVHKLLSNALMTQKKCELTIGIAPHPLFELCFYHGTVIELCLKKKNFNTIFNNPDILICMQKGLLDPIKLFRKLTHTPKDIDINNKECNIVLANLEALGKIVDSGCQLSQEDLITLLISSKTKSFFQNTVLVDLFTKGLINSSMVEKVLMHKIKKIHLEQLSPDIEKIKYLTSECLQAPKIVVEKRAAEVDDSNGEDILFFAPEITTNLKIINDEQNSLESSFSLLRGQEEKINNSSQELFVIPDIQDEKEINSQEKPEISMSLLIKSFSTVIGKVKVVAPISPIEEEEQKKEVNLQ